MVPITSTRYRGRGLYRWRPICFCCYSNSQPSSSRFPSCSGIRSSPFFIWWFKVGINRRCWVLCIRIFCHHFQLCFNGFDLRSDTVKGEQRVRVGQGVLRKHLYISSRSSHPYQNGNNNTLQTFKR